MKKVVVTMTLAQAEALADMALEGMEDAKNGLTMHHASLAAGDRAINALFRAMRVAKDGS